MKKLTDKQRLDWLTRQQQHMDLGVDLCAAFKSGYGWSLSGQMLYYATPRAAIDAAIRSEKAAKARKPQDPKGGKL